MGLGPGSQIGANLVLERKVGSGAMGTVWLAENRALGAKVAVKVLPLAMTDSDEALTRFEQEARAAAQLDSPHVVKTFDFGKTDEGQPYIVMELLRGRDLREEVAQRGRLPVDEVGVILRQLCTALSQAHARGLVHRDIKPANIFLLDQGTSDVFVKVLDFGIARLAEGPAMGVTETGSVMGTPYYMSPEQFIDPRKVDHRSDLWSAAVVAYGCLVGVVPFLGDTVGALSIAVHRGDFAQPSQTEARLGPGFDAFFSRAFQVDPQLRFADANEMLAAFDVACGAPGVAPAHTALPVAHAIAPTVSDSSGGAPMHATAPPMHATAPPGYPSAPPGYPSVPATHPGAAPMTTHAPTAATPLAARPTSKGLWLGVALAVLGLSALAFAFALPSLRGGDDARVARAEDDGEQAPAGKKKKKKKRRKKKKADAETEDTKTDAPKEPPPPAPLVEPTAQPASEPSATPAPPPPPKPPPIPRPSKWRYRGNTCAKFEKNRSCAKCCGKDIMKPYPSCKCYFDGDKWDREHGKAR